MAKKIKFRITDPQTGESQEFERDESEIPAKQKLAKERGLTFTFIAPELDLSEAAKSPLTEAQKEILGITSPKGSLVGGLLSGATLGGKEELAGLVGGEEAQRLAELETAAQQKEQPVAYGIGKFLGGLAPIGAAGIAGAKLGAAGGPVGALIGGALGAGAAGMAESALSRTMEEREREGYLTGKDIGMGALTGLTEGVGRLAAPYVRGITKKLFDSITARPISKLSGLERSFIQNVDELRKLENTIPQVKEAMKTAQGERASDLFTQYTNALSRQKVLTEQIKAAETQLMSSPQYSGISAIAPSGLATMRGKPEMTEEEISEYERLVLEEAQRRLQERKSEKPYSLPPGSSKRIMYQE